MSSKGRDRDRIAAWVRVAESTEGWRVERCRGHGATAFYPPDRAVLPIYASTSASDWRAILNVRARLRRAGLPVD